MNADSKASHRARRIEGYAQWIVDDVDGLTANLERPEPIAEATTILAEARERVALALARIDRAIERDKAHHTEQEHA